MPFRSSSDHIAHLANWRPTPGAIRRQPNASSHVLATGRTRSFEAEGNAKRYSRWVDDIVIGAMTRTEALGQIRRVQLALEALDLYPNAAKTRIIDALDFTIDYMKSDQRPPRRAGRRIQGGDTDVTSRFQSALNSHLSLEQAPRPKAWERVLRRFYTLSRTLDDGALTREMGSLSPRLPGIDRAHPRIHVDPSLDRREGRPSSALDYWNWPASTKTLNFSRGTT